MCEGGGETGKFMASESVSPYGSLGVELLIESNDNIPAREPRGFGPALKYIYTILWKQISAGLHSIVKDPFRLLKRC